VPEGRLKPFGGLYRKMVFLKNLMHEGESQGRLQHNLCQEVPGKGNVGAITPTDIIYGAPKFFIKKFGIQVLWQRGYLR